MDDSPEPRIAPRRPTTPSLHHPTTPSPHRPINPSAALYSLAKTPSKLIRNVSSTLKSMFKKGPTLSARKPQPPSETCPEPPSDTSPKPPSETYHSPYPLLKSLNIPTNFDSPENEIIIQNVLRELTVLHKENKRDITFTWANGRQACLAVVERVKSRECFFKMKRDWIMRILTHMNPFNVGEAASCLCSWLVRKFKVQFEDVARKVGCVSFTKMNAVQITAALDDANITHNACNILMRHLQHHLGVRLIEPLSKVVEIGKYSHQVIFGSAEIEKVKGKKPEKVQYYSMDICETLAADLERILNIEKTNERTTFGYMRNGAKTVDIVGGGDHGQGASRFVARINLLSSSERRKSGKIDTGSRQLTFAKTVCKKDTYEILNLTAAEISASFKRVQECMFVAERDEEGVVRVKVVEKTQHVETHNSWVVIPGFTLFICGDLAWYALAMGRDGCSGCRCPYCTLTLKEFQDKDKEGLPLTLEQLNQLALAYHDPDDDTDTQGVKYKPMVQVPLMHFIAPLLHINIGMTNKILASLLCFIDKYIEHLPKLEIERRKKLEELEPKLKEITAEVDQIKEHKQEFTAKRVAANVLVKQKTKRLREVNKERKKAETSTERRLALTDLANSLKAEISQQTPIFEEFKELASYAVKEFKEKDEMRLALSKIVTELRKQCSEMKKGRKGDKEGMESRVEDVMDEEARIKSGAYHGGALNGMSCQRLVQSSKKIMKRLSDICHEMHSQSNDEWGSEKISKEELTNKLNLFTTLFEVLDVVLSLLRKPDPTECEIKELEFMIGVLETLWRQAGISVTVKAHILFKHIVDQVKQFGGIADKVEDFVEKAHQQGMKMDDLTKRMESSFRNRQETQLNRLWAASDPAVQAMRQRVTERSRRTKRKSIETQNTTTNKRAVKIARREATVASFLKDVDVV